MLDAVIFFEDRNSLFYTKTCLSWEGRHNQDENWFQRVKCLAETDKRKFRRKKCKILALAAKYKLQVYKMGNSI